MSKDKRRILSTAWRVLTNQEDEQYRAFDRLIRLTDFATALDIWLRTKPDPTIVEDIMSFHLLQTPMRRMRQCI